MSGLRAIQYGIQHESEAVKSYETVTGNKVEGTGLWLHPSGLLGASPDGLVKHNPNLLSEVKCPHKAKDITLEEAMKIKDFFLTRQDGRTVIANNSQGPRYYHQIQGQLALTGIQGQLALTSHDICHFIVWTQKDMYILEVNKDLHWKDYLKQLMDFHVNNIFPVLVGQ